ncbi:MAG: hypothetical protein Ct9H90mP16_22080 [Candidatus Poseidoniales archaeon]|nr:MAG: hypothetical protein Ct9H90mP16_22080 [Candidatus Poseidoniales archaeon]
MVEYGRWFQDYFSGVWALILAHFHSTNYATVKEKTKFWALCGKRGSFDKCLDTDDSLPVGHRSIQFWLQRALFNVVLSLVI